MTGPVQLYPTKASHELVEVLTDLLEAAQAGVLQGLAFGAAFQGNKFFCDAAGSLHRNRVVALGVSYMLLAKLEHGIQQKSQETIF